VKRIFDTTFAFLGLLVLLPLLLLIALLIKMDSAGPVFFLQRRVGRGLRPFFIIKFRTMVPDAPLRGGPITFGEDTRITRMGKLLRKTKVDELPQFLNVLLGDMSFVGPRPEVPKYVELYPEDFREILQVRPGITDLASLKYRDEAGLLGCSDDPERDYTQRILPDKIRLSKEYLRCSSLWFDCRVIFKTLMLLVRG